jgi:hypothetical protein
VEVAWRERDRLPPDDRRYLATLRGSAYPSATPAREQLNDWEREVELAPDRADAWYRFGALLLAQGPAADVPGARERARIAFERAVALDSVFAAPRLGLVEVAALARDTTAVRHLGALYLAHDSAGDDADYVRWRVATLTRDGAGLRRLRARFGAIAPQSLTRIQWTSQMDGIALQDAESAVAVLMRRAADRSERARAIVAAGSAAAAPAVIASDLVRPEQWRLWHGDWRLTPRIISLSREGAASDPANSFLDRQADVLDAILASETGRSQVGPALEHLDSLSRQGCCALPHYTNLVIARLRERAGDLPGALRAARRAR